MTGDDALAAPPGEASPYLDVDGPASQESRRALVWALFPQPLWLFVGFLQVTDASLGSNVRQFLLVVDLPLIVVLAVVICYAIRVHAAKHSRASRVRVAIAVILAVTALAIGPVAYATAQGGASVELARTWGA